jgi:hypothetical protein
VPLKYAKLSETTNSQKKTPNIYTNLNSPNGNFWIGIYIYIYIYIGGNRERMAALYMLASSTTAALLFFLLMIATPGTISQPSLRIHVCPPYLLSLIVDRRVTYVFVLCCLHTIVFLLCFLLPPYDCISALFFVASVRLYFCSVLCCLHTIVFLICFVLPPYDCISALFCVASIRLYFCSVLIEFLVDCCFLSV